MRLACEAHTCSTNSSIAFYLTISGLLKESKYHSHLQERQEGESENYRQVSFTLILWKVMEQINLEVISDCMKDKKAVVSMDQ